MTVNLGIMNKGLVVKGRNRNDISSQLIVFCPKLEGRHQWNYWQSEQGLPCRGQVLLTWILRILQGISNCVVTVDPISVPFTANLIIASDISMLSIISALKCPFGHFNDL